MAAFRKLVTSHYGTKTLMFDADLAQAVLEEYNTGNRRVSQRKIEQMAAQMRNGEFQNTGEPLIMSAEGILNNGQHRLRALIEADAIVDMDVRFGIPRNAFTKTDTGTSRNPADILTIKGVTHGSETARAIRLLLLYIRGFPKSVREFVSNDEISRAYDSWKDISEVVTRVAEHQPPRAVRGAALVATAFLASRSPQAGKLDEWLEILATGLDVARNNPAYVARERIFRGADAPVGTRELLLERFALLIKSWNAFAGGKPVSAGDLRWRAGGKKPEEFPSVEGITLVVPRAPVE